MHYEDLHVPVSVHLFHFATARRLLRGLTTGSLRRLTVCILPPTGKQCEHNQEPRARVRLAVSAQLCHVMLCMQEAAA